MGQVSLPMLNRTSFFTFWDSVWDDFFNYKRSVREDIFVKKLIYFLLIDQILFSSYFISLNFFFFLKKFPFLNILKFKHYNDLTKFFKKQSIKTIPVYFSKLWVIRYQNWVLFSIYIYKPLIRSFTVKEFYSLNKFFFFKYINNLNYKNKNNYLNFKFFF